MDSADNQLKLITGNIEKNYLLNKKYKIIRIQIDNYLPDIQPGYQCKILSDNENFLIPIFKTYEKEKCLECLYEVSGSQHTLLNQYINNDTLKFNIVSNSSLHLDTEKNNIVIFAEGLGLAHLILFAQYHKSSLSKKNTIFLYGNDELPFSTRPSEFIFNDMPAGIIAAIPLLEDWNIPSRIACTDLQPGCYHGTVNTLLEFWLQQQTKETLDNLQIIDANYKR